MDSEGILAYREGFLLADFLHAYYEPIYNHSQDDCITIVRDDSKVGWTTLHIRIPSFWMHKDWK